MADKGLIDGLWRTRNSARGFDFTNGKHYNKTIHLRKNRGVSTAGGNEMNKDVMETSHRKVFREAIRDLEDHLTGLMDGFIRGIQP